MSLLEFGELLGIGAGLGLAVAIVRCTLDYFGIWPMDYRNDRW